MAIAHVVLGALLAGEANGYRVWQRMTARPFGARRVESARVYQTLVALERRGAVRGRGKRGRDGRPTRVYRLTRAGGTEIERWLGRPAPAAQWLRSRLLLKVALGGGAGAAMSGLVRDLELRRRGLRRLAAAPQDAAGGGAAAGDASAAPGASPGSGSALPPAMLRERARRRLEIEAALLEELLALARAAGAVATPGAGAARPPERVPALSSPPTPRCAGSASR